MSLVSTSIAQGQTKRLITIRSHIQATVTTVIREPSRLALSTQSRGPTVHISPARPLLSSHLTSSSTPSVQSKRPFHTGPEKRLQAKPQTPAPPVGEKVSKKEGNFSYSLAASYCGKQFKFKPGSHYLSFDPTFSQQWLGGKPIELGFLKGKRVPSGQDSCFISPIGATGSAAFGVADGVGGWIDQGIDSAAFSHGLCIQMNEICRRFKSKTESSWNGELPRDLLRNAYDEVIEDENIKGGGSTACLGIANRGGNLQVANLGDSGFMHLRLNKVHYVSDHQTHAFNTPYQLSQIPRKLKEQIVAFGGQGPISDTPKQCNVTNHALSHGDIMMFATDGVWDNLTSQDLLKVVSEKMISSGAWEERDNRGISVSQALRRLVQEPPSEGQTKSLQSSIAVGIVEKAKEASMDERRDSPFAKAVRRQYPSERYFGGKVDDICVVIGIAVDESVV